MSEENIRKRKGMSSNGTKSLFLCAYEDCRTEADVCYRGKYYCEFHTLGLLLLSKAFKDFNEEKRVRT